MPDLSTSNVAATDILPPVNPMAQIGALANTQNALNQNKMFQAKAIAGQYEEQATGPNGQPDPGRLNSMLLADPRTAPYAPEIMQNAFALQGAGLQNVGQGIANATNQQSLQAKQYAAVQSALAQTTDDSQVPLVLGRLAATNVISPDFATNVAGGGVPGLDSASLAQLRQQSIMGAGNPTEVAANIGTPAVVNTGSHLKTIVTKVGPDGATVAPATGPDASIQTTLSPSEINTPAYQKFNPQTGQMETVTQGVAAASPPTGPIPSGAPLGAEAAANTAGAGAAQQLTLARQDASGAQGRILVLNKALTGLQNSNTGPGTAETNNISSFLLAQGQDLAKYLPGVDPTKIKNYDEANKYLTQYAAGAASAYGPGTDQKLATAASGNASAHISNLAAQDVVKVNIGLERMKQAQIASFDQTGLPPQDYGSFSTNWTRSVDPRAFMIDKMTPAERKTMFESLSPTDKANFRNGVRTALQTGVYNQADLGQ